MRNINNFFNNPNDKYYDANYVINVLESMIGKTITNIKESINSSNITVNENDIKKFLKDTLATENKELKARMEKSRPSGPINLVECSKLDIEESTQRFMDELDYKRYEYVPYTLKYYKKYTSILKNKINRLLNIIENIGIKNYKDIQDDLLDLDIILDNKGNILKSDIIRLITPTTYNIERLEEKTNEANNLSTYLTNKLSLDILYKSGCSESEIYPNAELQIKNLLYSDLPGDVKLSDNQKDELREKQSKSIKIISKILVDEMFT